ncbi:MAG: ABC-F family ATP-binding cassette domain-containing protein [Erysipelotrichaceae bacterium]|nr:ABC-F family ATP-binding cassette domain-containing protein [Erysipelotrichaceae bacterium]
MGLLEVEGLRFKYTDQNLFNDVSFRILHGDHIVLVGDNGCGKSTFMNLIAKNLIPDAGKIEWLNNISYAYLDQHLKVKTDVSIYDYITEVFAPLLQKEAKMNEYYEMLCECDEKDYERYLDYAQSIQDELDKSNFYAMNSTLGNMINGLGIAQYGLDTPLKNLSGGQRAKVYLAKLLLEEPDVLLMDEPTNFLDVAHIEWLAKYLNDFKKAFVVISHDEGFLRQIGKSVYCLSNKVMTRYNMPYDTYLKERQLREEQYKKAYENQQKFIKKTEDFIQRNIVRATTTKQAQSRRKMLERISKLEKPKNHEPMHLKFPFSKGLGQEVLKLKNLSVGYGDKVVLSDLEFLMKQNQKIAILGHNGVGKSTILKTITGLLPKLGGEFVWNPSADLNYFAQEEEYEANVTPISYLRYYYHLKTDGELRSVLATAGIKGDLATKPMRELSGGQQTKVRLALMTMKKSNVLIFDEPTNHLDVASKSELWEAIDQFPGSVILVTHEDDFYEGLVDLELRFE